MTIGRAKGRMQSAEYSPQHYSALVPETKSNVCNRIELNWTVLTLYIMFRPLFRSLITEGIKLHLNLRAQFKKKCENNIIAWYMIHYKSFMIITFMMDTYLD